MLIGKNPDTQKDVTLNADDLTTHAVVLGRTGCGKSGATIALIEEAAMAGANVLAIDPKGDLSNLALAFPNLTPEDFAPFVPDGQDPEAVAEHMRQGLGPLAKNVAEWDGSAFVTIYTPGKTRPGGVPINILPSMEPPTGEVPVAEMRERAAAIVLAVLQSLGRDVNERSEPAVAFLIEAIVVSWQSGEGASLEEWPGALTDPPEELSAIDGLDLDEFFPPKDRAKLARQLVAFNRLAERWLNGEPLDMNELVPPAEWDDPVPRVSIFSLKHLEESDRQFFVALLMSEILSWLRTAPASKQLKLLVVIDEARGYLPSAPYNPPTKKPICTLLAQGRAQGVGVVIGTQNPNDLDYKALSNVGTWLVGRLRERDLQRDLTSELTERNVDPRALLSIPERHFYLATRDGLIEPVRIRQTYSYLAGPLTDEQLLLVHPPERLPERKPKKRKAKKGGLLKWLGLA
jgi:hypothetical protein